MPTNEEKGTCKVEIGGTTYDNFVSVTFKQSAEEFTGSGTIVLSWPGAEKFDANDLPGKEFVDGAQGVLKLDGQKAITFRIDQRISQGSASGYLLSLAFRGMGSAVVDSVVDHPSGQFNDTKAVDIAKTIIRKFGGGGTIKDESGESKEIKRFIVAEGEPAERSIRRLLREQGLNIYEDANGDYIITKKGESRGDGQALEIGKNFYEWTTVRDMSVRYSKYCAVGNGVSTDDKYGKKNEVLQGVVEDKGVPFAKFIRILVDGDKDQEALNKRAMYEANRRSSQGLNVTLKLSTWSDDSEKLWALEKDHHVKIPVDTIDGMLRVSALVFTMTATERSTQMTLMSTNAFSDADKPKSPFGGPLDANPQQSQATTPGAGRGVN